MPNKWKYSILVLALAALVTMLFVGCGSQQQKQPGQQVVKTGPPPGIPHDTQTVDSCLSCHVTGLNGRAPITPHPERGNCSMCHLPHGQEIYQLVTSQQEESSPWSISPIEISRADYDYVILAWNDVGMKCVSDNDKLFGLHYPSNTLWAQVIKKGITPEIITEGIEVRYQAPANRVNPAGTLDFWQFAAVLHGKELAENVGMAGLAADSGVFGINKDLKAFVARGIPVSPYDDSGKPDPYPLFALEVVDIATGQILATTKVNTPVSSETGCHKCHGGEPPVNGFGFGDETVKDFLLAHDKYNNTDLWASAQKGEPRFCQSCHSAPNIGAKGDPNILSLSAAMHGWHAQFIKGGTVEACGMCHPSSKAGGTVCLRDVHAGFGVECGQCHGDLASHAGSVLMAQKDIPAAARSIERIKDFWTVEVPVARIPWLQEPDCLACHVNHQKPEPGVSSYNNWVPGASKLFRNDTAKGGLMCSACHGSPHLVYSNSTFDGSVTNYQPESYQGFAAPIGAHRNCQVCHIYPMPGEFHHPNMTQPFIPPQKARP